MKRVAVIALISILSASVANAGCGYRDYTHPYVRSQERYRAWDHEQRSQHDEFVEDQHQRFMDDSHDELAPARAYIWDETHPDEDN
jgi:hypothetical protein